MAEWKFAQSNPAERLAQLHQFSMLKQQDGIEIEFTIRVYEYLNPPDPNMPFFAVADKQTNQATAPFLPTGWGRSLLEALSACMRNVHRFPYQPESVGIK